MEKTDVCEFCDGDIERRVVRTKFDFKGRTIFVDSVPAWVCNRCGEKYFDAPFYKRLEQIAIQHRRLKRRVSFPLARYSEAVAP